MELAARLTAGDLAHALVELAPLRLHFTPGDEDTRWIELERPESAKLVPGEGLRLACAGRLRYTIKGVRLEAGIHRIQLLVKPQVLEPEDEERRLNFRLRIEDLDIHYVPGIFDKSIVAAVDSAITPRTTELFWKFGQTLSAFFPMPDKLEPIDSLGLKVVRGEFEVGADCVEFRVGFAPLEVKRSKARPTDDG